MTYILTPIAGLAVMLLGWLVPTWAGGIVALFIKWDKEPSFSSAQTDDTSNYMTIRGDLPWWLRWFQTPDERFPCATYELAMRSMLERRGRYLTSWWWMGWRNQLMGLACTLGHQTTDYAPEDQDGLWKRDDGTWTFSFVLERGFCGFVAAFGAFVCLTAVLFGTTVPLVPCLVFPLSTVCAVLGPLRFLTGHKVYRLQNGVFWAAPTFTIKRAR